MGRVHTENIGHGKWRETPLATNHWQKVPQTPSETWHDTHPPWKAFFKGRGRTWHNAHPSWPLWLGRRGSKTTFTQIYHILPEFTGIYLNLPVFTWIYRYLPDIYGFYLNLLVFTWIYRGLPELTGDLLSIGYISSPLCGEGHQIINRSRRNQTNLFATSADSRYESETGLGGTRPTCSPEVVPNTNLKQATVLQK